MSYKLTRENCHAPPRQPAIDDNDDDHRQKMEQLEVSGTTLADFFPTLKVTSSTSMLPKVVALLLS